MDYTMAKISGEEFSLGKSVKDNALGSMFGFGSVKKISKSLNLAKKGFVEKSIEGTVNTKYTYNMVENPGPLAEINQGAASTFRSGMYNVYLGGGNQIFVPEPWKINGVERISSTPIK
jgi:hypothetical protein